MKCDEIKLEISALLDGSLAASDAERVQSHCRRCPGCRDFLEEQRQLISFLRTNDVQLEPSSHLWYQIRERIETQPGVAKTSDSSNSWWALLRIPRWAYASVAAAALLLLSFLLIDFHENQNQERYLAELESYTLQVADNPFLSEVRSIENPFFSVTAPQDPENPFESGVH